MVSKIMQISDIYLE